MVRQDVIDDSAQVIKLYTQDNLSFKAIGKIYNCDARVISGIIKNNNIEIRDGGYYNKKYLLDEHSFDNINTSEKAYVLGFLYADGFNNTTIGKISISIAIYDRDILEKIRRVFKSTAPIRIRDAQPIVNTKYIGSPTANLTLHSVYLSNKLSEWGVKYNKTTILEFPTFISKQFLKDFVRGYFDGDGTITIGSHGNPKISLISTKVFLQGIVDNCTENKWNSKIQSRKTLDEHIGLLELNSKADVKAFTDWMYKDAAIYCNRKYNRYYSYYFLNQPLEKYQKLSSEELLAKYGYEDVIPQYGDENII